MQDAQDFRKQAALCLEIARQMSDKRTAAYLRMFARHYFEKAAKLDHKSELGFRLIKSTIRVLLQGRPKRGNYAPTCHSAWRCA